MRSHVDWIACSERLPDDELSVLICLDNGEVYTGFHLDKRWHDCTGMPISHAEPDRAVTWWADYPEGPNA